MRIAVGSDHHGVDTRSKLCAILERLGHEVMEFGPDRESPDPVDYPDVASEVAGRLSRGEVDRGVLICGTGIGMSIAANKFAGVRAAPVFDEFSAELSRRHNDLNLLCLSGDNTSEELVDRLVEIWLDTPFEEGRHSRRVDKIKEIEQEFHGKNA